MDWIGLGLQNAPTSNSEAYPAFYNGGGLQGSIQEFPKGASLEVWVT